jgi:TPR repeat protein
MNLDWDWPPYPPAPTKQPADARLTVEILPGDLGISERIRVQRARHVIERWRREVQANQNDARACNELAWAYLTAPEALRNVEAALSLAEQAVRQASTNGLYRNTLGVAYYRAGRYCEAAEIFRSDLPLQEDKFLAYDLYFLAMSHCRLDETTRARDYYDWAVRWAATQRDLQPEQCAELTAIRAEAEGLLKSRAEIGESAGNR